MLLRVIILEAYDKGKEIIEQMINYPKVEISGMDKKRKWIRITGNAVFDSTKEARKKRNNI